jgi:aspartyl-tRNA(Asn)/glutamyl-tRNA(Gln) amidotransferase subunit A
MSREDITHWTAVRIASEVASGKVRAEEVLEAFLERIRRFDPKVRAFTRVLENESKAQARAVDQKIKEGNKVGRLAGVPIAIKDNLQIRGIETTCSSKILAGYKAPYNATVIERLQAEDAVFVGKTNLDEFAMGSSTENSALFKTANPWDVSRVPGGSSGGSAAAVAARMAAVSLGSDTGGSIRQPAALCGIVGIKPTYGVVSRFGLVAFASSLDQIGPFARNVEDAALTLSVIAGHDPKDSTSVTSARIDYAGIASTVKGLKIGVPKEYFIPGTDPEVERSVQSSLEALKKLGAETKEISLPHTRYAVSAYYIIAPAEASANLSRFDGIRYGHSAGRDGGTENLLEIYEKSRGSGFGPEVKRRIMLGTYALSAGYYDAYYLKAQKVRTLLTRDFDEAFRKVDAIVTPTSPTAAFRLGEKSNDPLAMYLADIYTVTADLAGIPGISIPCGETKEKLPIGLQILGRHFDESAILRLAHAYEQSA